MVPVFPTGTYRHYIRTTQIVVVTVNGVSVNLSLALNRQVSHFATVGKYGLVLSIQEGKEKATFEPPVVDFGNVATIVAAANENHRSRGGRLGDAPGEGEERVGHDSHGGNSTMGGGAGEHGEQHEYLPNG